MSSDTYEEAEAVKLKKLPVQKAHQQRERGANSRLEAINAEDIRRHADLSAKDTAYQGSATRRRVFCDVINAHSCCLAAILVVIVSQVTVGLVLMMIINAQYHKYTEEISELSITVDALKRNLNNERNRSAALEKRLGEEMTAGFTPTSYLLTMPTTLTTTSAKTFPVKSTRPGLQSTTRGVATSTSSINEESNAYVGGSVEPEKVSFGGEGSDPGKFLRNYGVAVSADNEIYVTDVNNERIQVFSINGVFLRLFPALVPGGHEQKLMHPHDVALDANGFLWVVGNVKVGFLHEVHVVQYNRDGQPMTTFKLNSFARFPTIAVDAPNNKIVVAVSHGIFEFSDIGLSGSFEIGKGEAIGYITHGNDGSILVTDRSSNSVRVYNRTGKLLLKFGEGGTGEGQLHFPQGICTDKFGHVMVANWGNDRVDMFTSRGEFVRTVVNTPSPLAIAIGPAGQLVVTDSLTDTVIIFRLHGL